MADDVQTETVKVPVWFWIVGGIATIWNFFGVFDYLLARLATDFYMAQMTTEQAAYYEAFPIWFSAIWALAVWGAFIASILLLLRNKLAFPLFAGSLAGFVINSIYSFGVVDGLAISGIGGLVFTLVIFASLVALTWLSHQWSKSGLLR